MDFSLEAAGTFKTFPFKLDKCQNTAVKILIDPATLTALAPTRDVLRAIITCYNNDKTVEESQTLIVTQSNEIATITPTTPNHINSGFPVPLCGYCEGFLAKHIDVTLINANTSSNVPIIGTVEVSLGKPGKSKPKRSFLLGTDAITATPFAGVSIPQFSRSFKLSLDNNSDTTQPNIEVKQIGPAGAIIKRSLIPSDGSKKVSLHIRAMGLIVLGSVASGAIGGKTGEISFKAKK